MSNFFLEAAEAVYYTSLWMLDNNCVLQMYSHAVTLI